MDNINNKKKEKIVREKKKNEKNKMRVCWRIIVEYCINQCEFDSHYVYKVIDI